MRKIDLSSKIGLIEKPEDVKRYIENDNELKDYRIIYVGKTGNIKRRLREYYNGVSGGGSTAPALVRSIVGEMNEILPFDNIVRTYINTGVFITFESKEAVKMEKELIEILEPKLNARKKDSKIGRFIYVFLHKHTPEEFLKIHFPELENMKEYILKRCFELNLEGLPYDEEQEAINLHSELKTDGSY